MSHPLTSPRRALAALAFLCLSAGPALPDTRVLSIGGAVTEIVYALGEEDRLIGRDSTSLFPAEAEALPDVGYMRALSPEGILSVAPTLIIAEAGSGPAETIDVMSAAEIPFVTIPDGFDPAAVNAKISAVADALGVPEKGAALAAQVDAELAQLNTAVPAPKKVMFILSAADGRIMAAGQNTAASGIITLAGGVNAVTGFDGYKPLTDEAITQANPDTLVMMDRGGDHAASDAALWAHPALGTTAAARSKSIIRLNGLLLLGFGPRTPEAALRLHHALYPQ